jgi:toxin ParE1/3/4
MNFGLRILPEADDDVDDAALSIAQDSIEQAMRFYGAVNATYKMILESPRRWPLYGLTHARLSDLRKRAVLGFSNHLVFYWIDADAVEIVRVLHGARDLSALFEEMD